MGASQIFYFAACMAGKGKERVVVVHVYFCLGNLWS